MTNTYIRKIDKLGRIVLPIEIREKLNIKEFDDLIIELKERNVVIKSYSYLKNFEEIINKMINSLNLENSFILITDRTKIISFGKFYNTKLSNFFLCFIKEPHIYKSNNIDSINIGSDIIKGLLLINPLIKNGICIGLIILISTKDNNCNDLLISNLIKNLVENINLIC